MVSICQSNITSSVTPIPINKAPILLQYYYRSLRLVPTFFFIFLTINIVALHISYITLVIISQFPIHSFKCLCAKMNNSNVTFTRTILHDLYEKQRQSPYYDNLCRPVSDLVPFIASGIRGVTTNPAVFFTCNYSL